MQNQPGDAGISPQLKTAIQARFGTDTVLFVKISYDVFSKGLFVVSQDWIALFKSMSDLRKPKKAIARQEFKRAAFDEHTQSLEIFSIHGEKITVPSFERKIALHVLTMIDKDGAKKLQEEIAFRSTMLTSASDITADRSVIELYSNHIRIGRVLRTLDSNTLAEVISGGQVVTTSRPTLTRMGALAILPGTALIPGLAFQKKSTQDTREVTLILTNANWHKSVNIRPDCAAKASAFANRINAVVNNLANASLSQLNNEQLNAASQATMVPPSDKSSLASQLAQLSDLHSSGKLSDSEFTMAKLRILEQKEG